MTRGQRSAIKWKQRKISVFNKYSGKCAYCGYDISLDNFQIDHLISKHENKYKKILPVALLEHIDNLLPSCCSCNNFKRAHTLETFRREIELQIIRLRRDHPTFRLAERYGLLECHDLKIQFYFEKLLING